jgi:hypothetical protein
MKSPGDRSLWVNSDTFLVSARCQLLPRATELLRRIK